jgi:iron-sulfur cluster assembly protein
MQATQRSHPITLSDLAKQELQRLEVGQDRFLRLSVVPGGCSGMTYGAALDDTLREGDEVLYQDEQIRIVAEGGTTFFLDGLHIDYSNDLIRSGFRFVNKNASGSCGCGASFKG